MSELAWLENVLEFLGACKLALQMQLPTSLKMKKFYIIEIISTFSRLKILPEGNHEIRTA
jgi:hypothetical protein